MDYLKQYFALVNGVKLITMFGLIGLDFVLGVLVAVWSGKFQWNKLSQFADTNVLKMAGGYFLVGLFAFAEPTIGVPALYGTWTIIDVSLIADCVNHFKELGVLIKNKEVV